MVTEIDLIKYKVQSSLLFSTRYFFKHKYGKKFVIGDHHRIIAETLERVLRGELTRVIFHVAPRYGKTEMAVKSFIAHGLSLNPAAKFIHLSYSDDLALDNSEFVKEIVTLPEYQILFPEVEIKKGSDSKKKWYTTKGGGLYATSAAGQVTGFGAGVMPDEEEDNELAQEANAIDCKTGFGGAIIIDDPIKPEDADSEVQRERVNNRFDSTIRNRVNSRKTPIIIIMQKLHERDLSGYLQENELGEWHVVSLPVIKEDGTALWPYKHTIEELNKLQKANEKVFDTQYLQDPTTKAGKLFPKSELNFYNPETVTIAHGPRVGVIDPADVGADDLSFPIGYLVDNKVFITDWIYNKDGTDINQPLCVEKIISHRLNFCTIESNAAWKIFRTNVKDKVSERYEECNVKSRNQKANKHTRIWEASAHIKNHFIFRSDYEQIPEYYAAMKNLLNYNKSQEGTSKNKHEDAPDSLALMSVELRSEFGDLW